MATQSLVVQTGYFELNPFMNLLIGTPHFVLYKLVLIPMGLLCLWFVRKNLAPKYLVLVKLTADLHGFDDLYMGDFLCLIAWKL